MEYLLSLCEKAGKEDPFLEKHTVEFFKSGENLMLVSPLDFQTFCWWINRLTKAIVKKYEYLDPKVVSYFPWVELNFTPLPEEALYTRLLVLEEPFGNHLSLLEALLRRRIANNLKTVIFHSKSPTDYVNALLSLEGVGRKVSLNIPSKDWMDF